MLRLILLAPISSNQSMSTGNAVLEVPLTPIVEQLAPAQGAHGISAEAFDALVRTHQRQIYRILLLQLRDADAAETLTQECFLRAYAKRRDFRGEASIGTWLIRIALNLARDHAKRRRVAFWRLLGRDRREGDPGARDVALPDPDPHPEQRLIARERLAAVWAKVDRLPSRQRTCFLLRYVEEMPIGEIARAMQVEVGTVKAHLAGAVGALRRHLQEWEKPCEDI
jgi:RNA polymerase sigma-70 factor (ECF subfamily)